MANEKNDQMDPNKGNPNPKGETKKTNNEKDNVFKKIGRKIGNGWRAVRDSPVATAIGAVGGAILTGAGILTYGYLKSRHTEEEELWEEPIEQEFDEAEEVESEEADDATEE